MDAPKLPEAFLRHDASSIVADASVQIAIRKGRFRSTESRPFHWGPEFLSIYRRRATHLERFSTPHAQRLRADVLTLCTALDGLPPECPIVTSSIEFDDGRNIQLFERADTNALLGLLITVDQRMVTKQEWAALWGTSDAG